MRIQKIQRLENDHKDYEIAMNALKQCIGDEEKCNRVCLEAMQKGPKRVRIASREELKIEINKYKNVSLRLMEEMKRNGIKAPGYASKAKLETKETGLRDEEGKEGQAMDHLETMSNAQSHMSLGGDFNEGEATEVQLIKEKHRLEEHCARLNMEVKDKNEKILELLEHIEDLKINIYSRDKAVELFQGQIQRLTEDLREAKQFEHKFKTVTMMQHSLEAENKNLMGRLSLKMEGDATQSLSKVAQMEVRAQ